MRIISSINSFTNKIMNITARDKNVNKLLKNLAISQ